MREVGGWWPSVDYPWLPENPDPPRPLETCERLEPGPSYRCSCEVVWDRIEQWRVPEGCDPAPGDLPGLTCYEMTLPESDVRYSFIQGCRFDDGYPGLRDGVLYGVVQRNRLSTGEWLTPVDLPLPNASGPPP